MAFLFLDALPSEETALGFGAITKGKKLTKTITHVRERTGVHKQYGVSLRLSDAVFLTHSHTTAYSSATAL